MAVTNFKTKFYIEREDNELELVVVGTYSYDPGKMYGPPETCYPPEEDFDYAITLNGVEWDDNQLTNKERDALETQIVGSLEPEYDEPEYDDDDRYGYNLKDDRDWWDYGLADED